MRARHHGAALHDAAAAAPHGSGQQQHGAAPVAVGTAPAAEAEKASMPADRAGPTAAAPTALWRSGKRGSRSRSAGFPFLRPHGNGLA
jgi:hypothetical protein